MKTMIKTKIKTKTLIAIALTVLAAGSVAYSIYYYGSRVITSPSGLTAQNVTTAVIPTYFTGTPLESSSGLKLERFSMTDPSKGQDFNPWMVGDSTTIRLTFNPASNQTQRVKIYRYIYGTANPQPYTTLAPQEVGATCTNGVCTTTGTWVKEYLCDQVGLTGKAKIVDKMVLESDPSAYSAITSYADCSGVELARSHATDGNKGTEANPWKVGDATKVAANFSSTNFLSQHFNYCQYKEGQAKSNCLNGTLAEFGATCNGTRCSVSTGIWEKQYLCDRHGLTGKGKIKDRLEVAVSPNVDYSEITWWADCSGTQTQSVALTRYSPVDGTKGTEANPWKIGDATTVKLVLSPATLESQQLKYCQYKDGTAIANCLTGTAATFGANCANGVCTTTGNWTKEYLCDRHGLTGKGKIKDRVELVSNPSVYSEITWWADCSATPPPPPTGNRCTNNGSYDFSGGFLEQGDLDIKTVETKSTGWSWATWYSGKGVLLDAVSKNSTDLNAHHKIIYLKGNDYQRGYLHGYLLAQNIKDIFTQFFYNGWFCADQNGDYTYFKSNVNKYYFSSADKNEMQGMLDGVKNKTGLALNIPGKSLDINDIRLMQLEADWSQIMGNEGRANCLNNFKSIVEANKGIFCSGDVFSGRFTKSGGPIAWRSLDYPMEPEIHSTQNHTIFLVEDYWRNVKYISILRPGSIGIATGFNKNGVFIGLDSASEKPEFRTSLATVSPGERKSTQIFLRDILTKSSISYLIQDGIQGTRFTSANDPTIMDSNNKVVAELGSWGMHTRKPLENLYASLPQDGDFVHNVNSYLSSETHPYFSGDDGLLENLYRTENDTLSDYVTKFGTGNIDAKAAFNIMRGFVKNWDNIASGRSCTEENYPGGMLRMSFDARNKDFVLGFGTAQMSGTSLKVKPIHYSFDSLFNLAASKL